MSMIIRLTQRFLPLVTLVTVLFCFVPARGTLICGIYIWPPHPAQRRALIREVGSGEVEPQRPDFPGPSFPLDTCPANFPDPIFPLRCERRGTHAADYARCS